MGVREGIVDMGRDRENSAIISPMERVSRLNESLEGFSVREPHRYVNIKVHRRTNRDAWIPSRNVETIYTTGRNYKHIPNFNPFHHETLLQTVIYFVYDYSRAISHLDTLIPIT